MSSPSHTTRRKKRVSFGDVNVTEYPIELGINPAGSGCPITIGWNPLGSYSCDLDIYEQYRMMGRSRMHSDNALMMVGDAATRRKMARRRMVLSVRTRTQMLLDAGYTPDQIIERTLQVAEIRDQREESIRKSTPTGFFSMSLNLSPRSNKSGSGNKLSEKFRKSFGKISLGNGIAGSMAGTSQKPPRKTLTARSA